MHLVREKHLKIYLHTVFQLMYACKMRSLFVCVLFILWIVSCTTLAKINISELETQLKTLNKQPVVSFQSEDGSTVDCIDILKQPAFDHPLLKNHTIQMRPSSIPEGMINENSMARSVGRRERIDCPPNTIPIQRLTKKDLIREKSLSKLYRANADALFNSKGQGEFHFAAVRSIVNKEHQEYYGIKARISAYNLTVAPGQFSDSVVWVVNGLDSRNYEQLNFIQYGLTVNQKLYGDNLLRTHACWTRDGFHKTGCCGRFCNGFVQVNRRHYIGQGVAKQSVPGGSQYVMDVNLFKDPKSGNWWIVEYMESVGVAAIGYWPKSIFTNLANSASVIQFGGEAYTPSNVSPPPMGNGQFEPKEWTKTAHISNIKFVGRNNKLYEPKHIRFQLDQDLPKCYGVDYKGYFGELNGYTLLFGGPGGEKMLHRINQSKLA